jgi:hypothetical protein
MKETLLQPASRRMSTRAFAGALDRSCVTRTVPSRSFTSTLSTPSRPRSALSMWRTQDGQLIPSTFSKGC